MSVRTQIRAAVQPRLGKGFFALDLDAVQKAVAALPWVESVEARKRWPDTLELRIYERQPFARWNEKRLISRQGMVFDAPRRRPTMASAGFAWPGRAAGRSGQLSTRKRARRSPARSCRSAG